MGRGLRGDRHLAHLGDVYEQNFLNYPDTQDVPILIGGHIR